MRSSVSSVNRRESEPGLPARPLGYGERLWLRLSEAASNNGVFVVFVQGPLDRDRLDLALRHTMAAMPILRAHVEQAAGRPVFVFDRDTTPPLRRIVREGEGHWQRLAEQELDQGIHPNSPLLWRVTLLESEGGDESEILFNFNHGIIDGHSLQLMLDGVMRCYQSNDNALTPQPPPANYECFLPATAPALLFARALALLIKPLFAVRNPVSIPTSRRPLAGRKPGTRFRVLSLDNETSKRLVLASKDRGESFHGLLGSLFLMATRDALGLKPVSATLNMSAAANVRPLLQGDFSKEVGYFATGFESRFSLEPDTELWGLANRVNQDTRRQYQAGKVAMGVFMKRLILALKKRPQGLVQSIARHNRTHIHLTNLGRMFVQPRYGEIRVTRLMALPSMQFMGKPMVCLESHFFNHQLQLTFSYPDPVIEADFVKRLVSRFEGLLHRVAGLPETDYSQCEEKGKDNVATGVRT
ncbi:MAG: condensation domain-containing protein [Oleiphilaceae bacterium]|nr:condensation domain-containing protein [Oleiphilaceae bacterium]